MVKALVEAQGGEIELGIRYAGIRLKFVLVLDHNEWNEVGFTTIEFIPPHSQTNHYVFTAAK
jgi:hypothetical protein